MLNTLQNCVPVYWNGSEATIFAQTVGYRTKRMFRHTLETVFTLFCLFPSSQERVTHTVRWRWALSATLPRRYRTPSIPSGTPTASSLSKTSSRTSSASRCLRGTSSPQMVSRGQPPFQGYFQVSHFEEVYACWGKYWAPLHVWGLTHPQPPV